MALKYNQNLKPNWKKKNGKKKQHLQWPLLVEEIGSDMKSYVKLLWFQLVLVETHRLVLRHIVTINLYWTEPLNLDISMRSSVR